MNQPLLYKDIQYTIGSTTLNVFLETDDYAEPGYFVQVDLT